MEIKQKFNRWLAKHRLIKRYEYLNEVNKLMEEYTTEMIFQGGTDDFMAAQRKELLKIQGETAGTQRLLEFLKGL